MIFLRPKQEKSNKYSGASKPNAATSFMERPFFIEEPLLMKKFSNSTANPNPHGGKEHYRIQNDEDSDSDENPTLPG